MDAAVGVNRREQVLQTQQSQTLQPHLKEYMWQGRECVSTLRLKCNTNRNWEYWRRSTFKREDDEFYLGYIEYLAKHRAGEYLRKLEIQDRASENGQVGDTDMSSCVEVKVERG